VRYVLIFAHYCHVTRTINCFGNYLRLNIHGMHMKCIPTYCNITQELRGTRMRLCVQLLWPAFYRCSMRTQWVVWKIYLYSLSVHMLLIKSTVISHCRCYLWQSGSPWWHIRSILDVCPKDKIKGNNVRSMRWPSVRHIHACKLISLETCDTRSQSFPYRNEEVLCLGVAGYRNPLLPKWGMRTT
jgi:hypothetical protein